MSEGGEGDGGRAGPGSGRDRRGPPTCTGGWHHSGAAGNPDTVPEHHSPGLLGTHSPLLHQLPPPDRLSRPPPGSPRAGLASPGGGGEAGSLWAPRGPPDVQTCTQRVDVTAFRSHPHFKDENTEQNTTFQDPFQKECLLAGDLQAWSVLRRSVFRILPAVLPQPFPAPARPPPPVSPPRAEV